MTSSFKCKCHENYLLAHHTTLKIGGAAQYVFFPSNVDELLGLRKYLNENKIKMTLIGAGSNMLVSSAGVSGAVVFTKNLCSFVDLGNGKINAEGGMKSVQLAKIAQEMGLTGLEFLIGIPGTIGGAVVMNSSAHGQAIEDVIECVEVLDLEGGKIEILAKEHLALGYRTSFAENNRYIILNAVFNLNTGEPDKISELMDFHISYRKEKHPPMTEPSAGSTFRNPARGVHVGRLIEELGLKGYIEGGAKISEKHANFIINTGGAASLDVSRLMHRVYTEVKAKYGYDLIAEIRFIGEMSEEEEKIWTSFQVH